MKDYFSKLMLREGSSKTVRIGNFWVLFSVHTNGRRRYGFGRDPFRAKPLIRYDGSRLYELIQLNLGRKYFCASLILPCGEVER